jgi:hypothetical protein
MGIIGSGALWSEICGKRRNGMKRPKLIQLCFLFLLCIGFAGWVTHASGQGANDAAGVGDILVQNREGLGSAVDHYSSIGCIEVVKYPFNTRG